jgi:hypothetical protein
MARVEGKFLKGSIGNYVHRELNGQQIVQAAPRTLKSHRTVGTVQAATTFGHASKLASELRWGLVHICGNFYNGTMIYRLNAEVLRCLNRVKDPETQLYHFKADSFQSLAGFEFNADTMVKQYLFARPLITLEGASLQVEIPEMKIPVELKFPIDRPKCCRMIIEVTMIDLVNGHVKKGSPKLIEIPYHYKPTMVAGQAVQFDVVPGCLCVIGISLQIVESTFAGESVINNKTFNPAAILSAVIAEGATDPEATKKWREMDFKIGK